ncbi:hypothetical protein [Lysobacter sp. Root690]|uniref:hypothetical protein n=1 Tax=Lysobacter sp. Root690 TaxID=1736588 RepID=UPI0006F24E69|nr:hypothetical protein [Lysobacter sp. Root690]KRB04475.1 hypothetical protein ASD86_19420 [Lysobacter sp. Root690]
MLDLDTQLWIANDALKRRAPDIVDDACVLHLLSENGDDPRVLELGIALLGADWHESHEELGECMQWLRAPELIFAFYRASLQSYPYHYDGGIAIRRRFTWALADIGNQAAFDALLRLCGSADRQVALFAFKRLRGWTREQPRKRFAYSPRLD